MDELLDQPAVVIARDVLGYEALAAGVLTAEAFLDPSGRQAPFRRSAGAAAAAERQCRIRNSAIDLRRFPDSQNEVTRASAILHIDAFMPAFGGSRCAGLAGSRRHGRAPPPTPASETLPQEYGGNALNLR